MILTRFNVLSPLGLVIGGFGPELCDESSVIAGALLGADTVFSSCLTS
ncbi:MAG: hypothetical protein ACXWEO_07475 [Methylobacter sp.]